MHDAAYFSKDSDFVVALDKLQFNLDAFQVWTQQNPGRCTCPPVELNGSLIHDTKSPLAWSVT